MKERCFCCEHNVFKIHNKKKKTQFKTSKNRIFFGKMQTLKLGPDFSYKNSNIQGRSSNVVKVIFHSIKNCC